MRGSTAFLAYAVFVGVCALGACAHDVPAPLPSPPPVVTVKVVCPVAKTYSAADQTALAAAVAALPPTSPLVGAMVDYGALRAKLRACTS